MHQINVREMTLAESYDPAVNWNCQLNCLHMHKATHRVTYLRTDGVKLTFSACEKCAEEERSEELPPWDELTPEVQAALIAAHHRVAARH